MCVQITNIEVSQKSVTLWSEKELKKKVQEDMIVMFVFNQLVLKSDLIKNNKTPDHLLFSMTS